MICDDVDVDDDDYHANDQDQDYGDNNGDGEFWRELESDIANGLNNENEYCEDDFGGSNSNSNSDLDSGLEELPCFTSTIDPVKKNHIISKPKKCDDSTSHYHCYCLRSTVAKHRFKNYIGFTTNPERRLKQHNGILKHGGAWKTKRGGRPWEFVVLVAGFPTHTMALQFEWAWQHPGKSLLVRAAIGEKAAKTLQRKRGTPGQMSILKTLLELCPDLYNRNSMTLNFLQEENRAIYVKAASMPALPEAVIAANLLSIKEVAKKRKLLEASDAAGLPPPPPRQKTPAATVRVISDLSEMPFWATRKQKPSRVKRRAKNKNIPENIPSRSVAKTNGTGRDTIENEVATSNNSKGIGDIYRRCCDSKLFWDNSSSEDERESDIEKVVMGNAFLDENDNSNVNSSDDVISIRSASDQDIRMRTFSIDSSSSSELSEIGSFLVKRRKNDRKLEVTKEKIYSDSTTTLSNVISIDDDSSDDSLECNNFLYRQNFQKENVPKKTPLSLQENNNIDAMTDENENGNGKESNSNDAFVPLLSLEEKIDALTVMDDSLPSSKRQHWVTTRRKKIEVCIDGVESEGDHPSFESKHLAISSSSMIVDLCTP